MRFMMIIKSDANTEAGIMPSEDIFEQMATYNEELVKAGVMVSGEGLHPSSQGARIYLKGDNRRVVDGPFAEAKELIAGFWIIQTDSLAEAIEWAKKCPCPPAEGDEELQLELRRIFEDEDFGDALSPEVKEREARMREEIERQHGS